MIKEILKINAFSKGKKNEILSASSKLFLSLGLSSDRLTVLSFIFGLISIYFLAFDKNLFIVFFLFSVVFDLFDGSVAKLENKSPSLKLKGILFDDLSDRTIFFLIIMQSAILTANYSFFIVALAYLFIKGIHIFLKQKISLVPEILYIDRLAVLLVFFSEYQAFISLVLIVLLINLVELYFLKQKISTYRKSH